MSGIAMLIGDSHHFSAPNRGFGAVTAPKCGIHVPRLTGWALVVFVASVPFETLWQAGTAESPIFSLSRITAAVLALAFLTHLPIVSAPSRPFLWYLTYLAAAASSLAYNASQDMADGWVQMFTTVQLLMVAWIIEELSVTRHTFARVLTALRLSIGGLAVLQAFGIMTHISGATDEVRTAATGVDPNTTGAVYAIGFVAHAWNITGVHTTRTGRILSALLLVPIGVSLARTGSRGALAALGAGLIALLAAGGTGKGRIATYCKTALIAGVVVVAVMMSSSTVTRLQLAVAERHYGQRDELWLTSLGMVVDKPILGWGPYLNYYELGGRMGEAFLDTHNSFLLVFTQAGLLGGVPYLIGFGYSVIAAVRARRDSFYGIVFPLLMTVIVINQSLSWHNRKLHWIILALALSSRRAIGPAPAARPVLHEGRTYVNYRHVRDRATV